MATSQIISGQTWGVTRGIINSNFETLSISNIATLRNTVSENLPVNVLGYYTSGDGGGGVFIYVDDGEVGEYVDNGISIIVPTGGNGSAAFIRQYNGFIDVRWGGATGDGSTDDTLYLQRALDIGGGSTVFFPNVNPNDTTTYMSSVSLYVKSNTRVLFDKGVILKRIADTILTDTNYRYNNMISAGPSKGAGYTAANMGEGVVLENITIDGNCENQSSFSGDVDTATGGWGISVDFVYSATVKNCNIHHCFAGGFRSSRARGLVVDNVECSYNAIQSNFGNNGNGFDFNGQSDNLNPEIRGHILVSNCRAHNNADNGFVIVNTVDISLTNCHAWENGDSAYSTNSSMGFEFGGSVGDTVDCPTDIQFNNCSADSNNRDGSTNNSGFRATLGNNTKNLQFNNCIIKNQTGGAISISFYASATYAEGKIQLNNINADYCGASSSSSPIILVQTFIPIKNITLSNIIVSNSLSTGSGVAIYANTIGGEIENLLLSGVNTSYGNGSGIYTVGNIRNTVLNGCISSDNQNEGFKITPGSGYVMDKVTISGCQVLDNNQSGGSYDGISFYPKAGTISEGIISGTTSSGNRYGVLSTMVEKLKIDEASCFDGNTFGPLNIDVTGSQCNQALTYPTFGTWRLGEVVWNRAAELGEYTGWVCISAGTPGTWEGFGRVGYYTFQYGAGTPVGTVTPNYVKEEYLDQTNKVWYKSYGLNNTDWASLN